MKTEVKEKAVDYTFENFTASIGNFAGSYSEDIDNQRYFGFPLEPILSAESRLLSQDTSSVAYFSMEYGLAPSIYNSFRLSHEMNVCNQFYKHEVFSNNWLCDYLFQIHIDKMLDIPIYGGGLGVLAGDFIKSSADLGYSVAGIGVLWNKGYFKQNFWYKHGQVPEELKWDPHTYPGLVPLEDTVSIDTTEGTLTLRLWKYYVYSYDKKQACPLVLLDSNLEQNSDHFKKLTDQLYRSDDVWWKIFQRSILGIGGIKALNKLGYAIDTYHLNEGHAAYALLEKYVSLEDKSQMDKFKNKVMFTCHTPVEAGHDRFQVKDVRKVLKDEYVHAAEIFGKKSRDSNEVNLTHMALDNSCKVNAVSRKHGEVMHIQFPNYANKIISITNGVHLHTWMSESMQALLDKYSSTFDNWRENPEKLAQIETLRSSQDFRRDLFRAHQENKENLMNIVRHWKLKDDVFTLGWARRIAGYKRPALIFHDIERVVALAKKCGPLQILLAGKAHPNDDIGSSHIEDILDHIDKLNAHKKDIKILILENYDTFFGKLLTSSVDVWLNNPLPPFEASGTSGMKAILNGVLQLSTIDGWVVEAMNDNIGWLFGYEHKGHSLGKETDLRLDEDSRELYDTLESVVSLYYSTFKDGQVNLKSEWIDKMINCIAKGAFFNTHRMVKQYNDLMWGLYR